MAVIWVMEISSFQLKKMWFSNFGTGKNVENSWKLSNVDAASFHLARGGKNGSFHEFHVSSCVLLPCFMAARWHGFHIFSTGGQVLQVHSTRGWAWTKNSGLSHKNWGAPKSWWFMVVLPTFACVSIFFIPNVSPQPLPKQFSAFLTQPISPKIKTKKRKRQKPRVWLQSLRQNCTSSPIYCPCCWKNKQ